MDSAVIACASEIFSKQSKMGLDSLSFMSTLENGSGLTDLVDVHTAFIESADERLNDNRPAILYAGCGGKQAVVSLQLQDGKAALDLPNGSEIVLNGGLTAEDSIRLMQALLGPTPGMQLSVTVIAKQGFEMPEFLDGADQDIASKFVRAAGCAWPQVFRESWNIDAATKKKKCGCKNFSFCKKDPNRNKRESCNAFKAKCNSGSNCE